MLEFILLMIVLNILMKIKVGEKVEIVEPKEPGKASAYVCGNSMEWEFKSLDDAMEFRELRLSGWKGNAMDFYEWKEEA